MKRFIIVALVLVLVLVACGGDDETDNDNGQAQQDTNTDAEDPIIIDLGTLQARVTTLPDGWRDLTSGTGRVNLSNLAVNLSLNALNLPEDTSAANFFASMNGLQPDTVEARTVNGVEVLVAEDRVGRVFAEQGVLLDASLITVTADDTTPHVDDLIQIIAGLDAQ